MGDNASAGPSSLLPPGWTSHISPAGRPYYHNASSGVSTYTFPAPKLRREKPISKSPVPHTGWLKVTTNKGNVFYFHPESKASEWLPPPEVAQALKRVEEEEREEKERLRREEERRLREERERVKRERLERKRKAEEGVPITEFDASKRARADDEDEENEDDDDLEDTASIASDEQIQIVNTSLDSTANMQEGSGAAQHHDTTAQEGEDDDDDDEEWQRQMAEQMAAEAEAEAEADADHKDAASAHPPQPEAPPSSLEEQKTAFMDHLSSLNGTKHEINPMAPWDLEQSKFSSHPSSLALPSREREDTFNEWCKLRLREKRAAKAAAASTATGATSTAVRSSSSRSADPVSATAEANLAALLKSQVRSTRTKFSDFKAAFSRDPRLTGYGRTDADREKLFKRHLVELGEEKRKAAEKAEREFLDLLSDRLPGNYRTKVAAVKADGGGKDKVMEVWLEAKRTKSVVEDKRYDAVGSSTRRLELFCDWAKGERRPPPSASSSTNLPSNGVSPSKNDDTTTVKAREKEAARAKALRDREEKVRRERERLTRINRSAFSAATREESLLSFRQLLLDAIHSPHVTFASSVSRLARDPRFDAPSLTDADRQTLFAEHQTTLARKEGDKIGHVFARHAKSLDSHPEDVLALALQDEELSRPPLNVYAQDRDKLEAAYERWDAKRREDAERAFQEMLSESAFVEFWGRLKKHVSTTAASSNAEEGTQRSAREEDEDEEAEGTTLVEMARKVDLREIESVLRNDARFRAWRHKPEVRQRWIREHLQRLAAPAKSVHR